MLDIRTKLKTIPVIRRLYFILLSIDGSLRFYGNNYMCPVCSKASKHFRAAKRQNGTYINKKVVDGGIRANAFCPHCNSPERIRFEYIILQTKTNMFTTPCKVLHFAPECGLSKVLRKTRDINYLSCDLQKGYAMTVADITDICFEDNTFDYIICNHVLEHVKDDRKALSELYRVLKPEGCAVLTIPISNNEATIEKQAFTDEERLKLYGQRDHVRLYGRDFIKRLKEAEFAVKVFKACEEIEPELIKLYALLPEETIFIARKS